HVAIEPGVRAVAPYRRLQLSVLVPGRFRLIEQLDPFGPGRGHNESHRWRAGDLPLSLAALYRSCIYSGLCRPGWRRLGVGPFTTVRYNRYKDEHRARENL